MVPKPRFALLLLLVLLVAASAQAQRPEELDGFARELDEIRSALRIPAMSAAVVVDQELIWAAGFGDADIDLGIAATPETAYQLASVTKPVAATLLMQLVEEGVLSLDDLVSTYVVGLDGSPDVTVRHLLTHTSEGVPGLRYVYNGNRYSVLSDVMEAATGTPFAGLLEERILRPAGMAHTAPNDPACGFPGAPGVAPRDPAYADAYAALATPYQLNRDFEIVRGAYPTPFSAAAGLISTVLDLARFDVALDRGALVSPQTREVMFTPAVSIGGRELPYGLGWTTHVHEGIRLVWHGGRWSPSISALYVKMPDLGLTFIALANTDNLSTPYPLSDSDVLYSTAALAFFKTFVVPAEYGVRVPRIDWQAGEDELVAALNAIDDPNVRRILERELWSYRQAFGSVGRTDLVLQLQRVHHQAFPDVQPDALDTYLFGGFAAYPPGSEGLAASDVDVGRFAGRYRLDPDLEDAPVPAEVTIVAAPGHLVGVDPGGGCITMVPYAAHRFRVPTSPGLTIDFLLEGHRIVGMTLSGGGTELPYRRLE